MKVLMLGRHELMSKGGGDKIQIVNTASELEKLGVEVDIKTDFNFDPKKYDIVHVFQLDWTPETYFYIKKAYDQKSRIVLSPIHHSIEEVKRFDDEYVFDFRRISKFLFKNQFHRDTFKNFYRSIFDSKKLKPTLFSIYYGFERMQKESIEMSDVVLVQTVKEASDLEKTFGLKFKWEKVPNGVGDVFIDTGSLTNKLSFDNYIICVGRIEPRKNQINIIKAVKMLREETGKNIRLVLVGIKSEKKHFEFYNLFEKYVKENDWVLHINKIPYSDMPAYYKFAKVCVSASWFETTGLTSLEALFCKTNAVASGDRAKEYLGDLVSYCDPGSIESIKNAIKSEYESPRPSIVDNIKNEYTWSNAAKKTLEVYNSILDKSI